MKYLKRFNESTDNNPFMTDPKEIREFIRQVDFGGDENILDRIYIHQDGTVDVEGSVTVILDNYNPPGVGPFRELMTRLPVKFGKVTGGFFLRGIKLTTLEGCPEECGGFDIYNKESHQDLKSLKGGPRIVNGDMSIDGLGITSLEGSPRIITGRFTITGTKITTLEGGPDEVWGAYNMSGTLIKDLKGLSMTGQVVIWGIRTLTSLEGIPENIGQLYLSNNNSPNEVWDPRPLKGSHVEMIRFDSDCKMNELLDLFNHTKNRFEKLPATEGPRWEITRRFIESLDYNYIRGTSQNPQINLFRLKEALSEFGLLESTEEKNIILEGGLKLDHYQFVNDDGDPVDFSGDPIEKEKK